MIQKGPGIREIYSFDQIQSYYRTQSIAPLIKRLFQPGQEREQTQIQVLLLGDSKTGKRQILLQLLEKGVQYLAKFLQQRKTQFQMSVTAEMRVKFKRGVNHFPEIKNNFSQSLSFDQKIFISESLSQEGIQKKLGSSIKDQLAKKLHEKGILESQYKVKDIKIRVQDTQAANIPDLLQIRLISSNFLVESPVAVDQTNLGQILQKIFMI